LVLEPVAEVGVQAEGVDHDGETAPRSRSDDLVEQVERVRGRVEIRLAAPDHGS
jgi:hypothetical protein